MLDNGSVQYASKRASEILSKAWVELEPILPKSEATQNLAILSKYLIKRDL